MKQERMWPVNVVAEKTGLSRETIYRRIRRGEIPFKNEGQRQTRVPATFVEAFKKDSE